MAKNENEIVVLGKRITVIIEDRDIATLRFWVDNPRVNSAIKRNYGDKKVNDKEIESILRNEEHVKELLQDIKKQGGLIDKILVKGNIVLEGNSRLCAYRMLYEKAEKAKDEDQMLNWSYMKAEVIPDNTGDEAIFKILGTWHISGKQKWDTFEKVAYIKRMMEQHNYTSKDAGEIIGESKTFVEENIEAHDLMIEHEIYDLNKFSYFIEMVKNRGIKQEEKKDSQTRTKLIRAIKGGQFNRAEEIRDVPKVLKDKVAKRVFFEEMANFADALEIAKERNPEFDDTFYRHLKTTTAKLKKLTVKKAKKIQEEIKNNTDKKHIIRTFAREVRKFVKTVGLDKN